MDRLHSHRDEIERLDREFVRLLARRMQAVREIGSLKKDLPGAPLRDEDRERRLFELWAEEAQQARLSPYFVGRVLREILNYSRRDQERFLDGPRPEPRAGAVRVGYQGVPACYSDLAITKAFATREVERLERVGFRSFRAAVEAIEAGEVDYVLLPIENTIAGSINEVYDLLASRSLAIVGEEVWPVEHCLVGLPGTTLRDVRTIRSHPVALQQCQRFLDGLVGCTAESYHDTAAAAAAVAAEKRPEIAAIAPEEAARAYGLDVLARHVSDQRTNLTRFLLVGTRPEPVDARRPAKTSLAFSVNHQRGALLRCLEAFDRQGINLTKLESRPQPNAPWEYLFYVDLEGRAEDAGVQAALGELRGHVNHLKVLGSYPRRTGESGPGAPAALPRANGHAANGAEPAAAAAATGAASTAACPAAPPVNQNLKLVSLRPGTARTVVRVGQVEIGAARFVLIAGPCAVESAAQVHAAAALVREHGASILRGGAFKPRTSPYAFQGLGFPGLDLLAEAGHAYELPIVTEVLRPEDVAGVARKADMLQVGARNMQNFSLLREVGKCDRPVLLKRGISATIEELLLAAEYIMAGGNLRVVLCERGIRTFETATRNTLDVSAVPVLKERTHLPVIVDPSHAAGRREIVVPLALAAAAAGADGLIVEAHPDPAKALCDKDQALTGADLEHLLVGLRPIVEAQGRRL
jgi:chorismate mutase/prephenate dehydratase